MQCAPSRLQHTCPATQCCACMHPTQGNGGRRACSQARRQTLSYTLDQVCARSGARHPAVGPAAARVVHLAMAFHGPAQVHHWLRDNLHADGTVYVCGESQMVQPPEDPAQVAACTGLSSAAHHELCCLRLLAPARAFASNTCLAALWLRPTLQIEPDRSLCARLATVGASLSSALQGKAVTRQNRCRISAAHWLSYYEALRNLCNRLPAMHSCNQRRSANRSCTCRRGGHNAAGVLPAHWTGRHACDWRCLGVRGRVRGEYSSDACPRSAAPGPRVAANGPTRAAHSQRTLLPRRRAPATAAGASCTHLRLAKRWRS